MFYEILSLILVSAIGSGVYLIFAAALTWAVELKGSLENSISRPGKGAIICRTCGTDFVDNLTIVDGKCQICGRRLCSRCGLEWICPLCYKERAVKERTVNANTQAEENLALANFIRILREDQFKKGSLLNQPVPNLNKKPSHTNKLEGKNKFGINGPKDFQVNQNNEIAWETRTWEQNWLFKKKDNGEVLKPLGMYLPSVNEIKAQIGGVNADDLSDLSDYSDSEIDKILK